jgi:hypothetical protein
MEPILLLADELAVLPQRTASSKPAETRICILNLTALFVFREKEISSFYSI